MSRTEKPSGRREARNLSSLERRSGSLHPRKRILIVCEGKETEPNYFDCLRQELNLSAVEIVVEGVGFDPSALVKRALRRRESARRDGLAFDEVWCVMDREATHQQAGFSAAVNTAGGNKIKLAVSNPAFEFWFLLHFTHTARPFVDAADLIQELKIYISDYEKNANVFPAVYHRTADATKQACTTHPGQSPGPGRPLPQPLDRSLPAG